MKFTFRDATEVSQPRLRAFIVDQDALPADLESHVVEGAGAARFAGKAGQVFETFVERGGTLVRLALAG
ncbi:MAG: leucyl aminopeptidase, partial [Oxalobacteraceae bacterium]